MLRLGAWTKCGCVLRHINKFPEFTEMPFYTLQSTSALSTVVKNSVPMTSSVPTWASSKKIQALRNSTTITEQKRWKSRKSKKQEDSDDSDEEESHSLDDDLELGKDFKEITVHSQSLRVDAVIKAGLGVARNKAEDAVLSSRVRLNGEKVLKKGVKVNMGDEVDLIKGINSKNEDFIDISRLLVKNVMEKSSGGKNVLILHRFRDMTVENYPDPWKGSEDE